MDILKKIYHFGDITGVFVTVEGATLFLIVPKGYEDKLNDKKIAGLSPFGYILSRESLVPLAVAGDGYSCDFAAGTSLRYSDSANSMRMVGQQENRSHEAVEVVTECETKHSLSVKHIVRYLKGTGALEMYFEVENRGEPVTLEALPSFNLCCISPFTERTDPQKLLLHRMRSSWSGEGKLFTLRADQLCFESSWSGLGIRSERWGQTGSMPSRAYLPFVAAEDLQEGVCWAATMCAPASWTMEAVFRNNNLALGGGQGDFLSAHWRKKLETGEVFRSKKAYVTVARGGLNDVCARLVEVCKAQWVQKSCERDLPVLYNEYCYSWCKPQMKTLEKMLPAAAELGCKYFVVDDGWFIDKYDDKTRVLGDWIVNEERFPGGLKEFSDKARSYGMIPGLWYEFESVCDGSILAKEHPDWLLTYDGKIINHQGRSFLDFRKEEVHAYLREKVIENLRKNNIGYLKVDYNDNIGLGTDGAESLGEGLRLHTEGVLRFYREIKNALPELVLEVCSSGGMRHEPEFLGLADMVSFSDAHECESGVAVAFNLHRFLSPAKMQIWATVRKEDTEEDVFFTLAKAMLGRVCFSGDLIAQSPQKMSAMHSAVDFYKKIAPILLDGKTTVIEDSQITSYLDMRGALYLIRESLDKQTKIVYAFSVYKPEYRFEIQVGDYVIEEAFHAPLDVRIQDGKLSFSAADCNRWGCVFMLRKNKTD